ncbi:MAG: hypothetical protein DRN68_09425, partial [Thaumarchaeota archaeon]
MALPRDREEDFRVTILTLIQDQMRKVVDGYRTLLNMLEDFTDGAKTEKLEEYYDKILKNDESAKETSLMIEREINNVGALLTDREGYIRLMTEIDRVSDITEGAAFRLLNLSKMKAEFGKNLNQRFLQLGETVLTALLRAREALLASTLDEATFHQKIKETEEYEKKADELYRVIDLEL